MRRRIIAIHLPQFHPFKENDEWWGKGFTEWTNVTKAKPRFRGHYQPHLPSDTGFYDLRLPEARQMQADMAKAYCIDGFCFYHYWFNGKRLMERPVNEMLASGKPDFPFMLCWANENWSRNWDGGFSEILIEQNYNNEDFANHMHYLCSHVFCDSRYIKVDNKPFFVVYKPELFPNVRQSVDIWRTVAKEYGLDLYLGYMTRYDQDFVKEGFDCAIDFQPHFAPNLHHGLLQRLKHFRSNNICHHLYRHYISKKHNLFNLNFIYKDYVKTMCKRQTLNFKMFPSVSPSWDNSPRRKGWFIMLKGSTPILYGQWLAHVLQHFTPFSKEENFVFINAWNEWAEGNHLEPDQKWGLAYLEETKKQIDKYNR
jgi:lipopolysaccharide biosynthesis protein